MSLETALTTNVHLTNSQKFAKYLVDSTAMLAATNPFFQGIELASGVSDDVSINVRMHAALWTYGLLGYVVPKLREVSRKLFNVPFEGKEKLQVLHDSIYLAVINIPIGVGLMYASGERDSSVIQTAVMANTVMGLFMGSYVGLAIDIGQDLACIKECKRKLYPTFLRKSSKAVKTAVGVGLIAASTGLMGYIYTKTDSPITDNNMLYDAIEYVVPNKE